MKTNIWRVINVLSTLAYACRRGTRPYKDKAVVIAANVSRGPVFAAEEMRAIAALRPGARRPYIHFVLSLEREKLHDDEWEHAVTDILSQLGLDPMLHPFLAARHLGSEHDHCHVVACRVAMDSSLWVGEHDKQRLASAARLLSKRFGLAAERCTADTADHQSIVDLNRSLGRQGLARFSSAAVTASLLEAQSHSNTLSSFIKNAATRGVNLHKVLCADGRLKGLLVAVERSPYRLGLSKVSKGLVSLQSLSNSFKVDVRAEVKPSSDARAHDEVLRKYEDDLHDDDGFKFGDETSCGDPSSREERDRSPRSTQPSDVDDPGWEDLIDDTRHEWREDETHDDDDERGDESDQEAEDKPGQQQPEPAEHWAEQGDDIDPQWEADLPS